MAKYIDSKALSRIYMSKNKDKLRLATVINELEMMLGADVELVKHGCWFGTVFTYCGESTSDYYDCDYCPKCGAKMDGGANH